MAIGMIEFQGTIQRTQDYSAMKHNEDMKTNVDQANYQLQSAKKEDQKANQIQKGDDSNKSENRADAREKGSNTYFANNYICNIFEIFMREIIYEASKKFFSNIISEI